MFHEVSPLAGEHIDDGNLNHRVASGLLAHGGTGHVDQHLTGEGGIVDAHVELQSLVLRLSTYALADQIHTVAHIADGIYRLYGEYVGLIVGKVGGRFNVKRRCRGDRLDYSSSL